MRSLYYLTMIPRAFLTQPDEDEAESDTLPVVLTWAEYLGRWVNDLGGWTQLAAALLDRAGASVEISQDPQTVERGLRRLATRGHKPGGQYGRWMLRYFGFASPIEELVKWMGQYHTRFSDLPSGVRLEHLMLWNRPPVSESRLASWIHIGVAHVQLVRADLAACADALALAERTAPRAGAAAEIEVNLLRARVDTGAGNRASARARLGAVETQLDAAHLPPGDDRAYRAQLHDQRAQHLTRPPPGEAQDLAGAAALYEAIDDEPYLPFVAFRRSVGLAYCAWQRGDLGEAARLTELAIEHAGDGGLLRMRVTALNMLTRLLTGDAAAAAHRRARRMATLLEDEDLLNRVVWSTPPAP
jgi:hypothetical protein